MELNREKSRRARSLMHKRKHHQSRHQKEHKMRAVARPRDKSICLEECWTQQDS